MYDVTTRYLPTFQVFGRPQRLCTFYLPPIWGYLSLRWLTRKGYL
jgi:hypothetical protein